MMLFSSEVDFYRIAATTKCSGNTSRINSSSESGERLLGEYAGMFKHVFFLHYCVSFMQMN